MLRQSDIKVAHKGAILVAATLCSLAFLLVLNTFLDHAELERQRETHLREVLATSAQLRRLLLQAVAAVSSYAFTKSEVFAASFEDIEQEIKNEFKQAQALIKHQPRQFELLREAEQIQNQVFVILNNIKHSRKTGSKLDPSDLYNLQDKLGALGRAYLEKINQITQIEQLTELKSGSGHRWRQVVKPLLFAGVALNVLIAVVTGIYFTHGITSRLKTLVNNTERLAKKKPLLPAIEGKDEIAQLDQVFHAMALTLEEAAAKERAIVDNAIDLICSLDKNNRFITASPACLQICGYTQEEMVEKRLEELVIPGDMEATLRALKQIKENISRLKFENRIKRKDGKILPVLWSAYWSQAQQTMFCIIHDFSEKKAEELLLKESAARLGQILESMPVGLVVLNDTGHIELSNTRLANMYGAAPQTIHGIHVRSLVPEISESSETTAAQMEKFAGRTAETLMSCVDGSTLPVDVSASQFVMHGERRLLLSITDVRERHEIEKLKEELQSMVSHDLKSPLTSVKTNLAVLAAGAMGKLNDSGTLVLQQTDRALDRLISLIDDLLDLEKMRSGKMTFDLRPTSVSGIIQQTVDSTGYLAEQKGIRLEVDGYDKDVFADGARIVQVLVNLVANAIKFSPQGTTVRIEVEEIPDWLEFRVSDEGRGIPKELQNSIFDKYTQTTKSDTFRGTGLGLAIARTIIEQHEGTISVYSKEGYGSTFWFRLPHSTSL